jgi:hypothetical protein
MDLLKPSVVVMDLHVRDESRVSPTDVKAQLGKGASLLRVPRKGTPRYARREKLHDLRCISRSRETLCPYGRPICRLWARKIDVFRRTPPSERMSKTVWRWTQACANCFSASVIVTGKNTGKLRLWFQPFGDNPRAPSLLAPISAIFTPIGTGNYQGMNRELKYPVNWVVAKMFESLAGDALRMTASFPSISKSPPPGYFRFPRNPSRIVAQQGDHCLQADFTGLITGRAVVPFGGPERRLRLGQR